MVLVTAATESRDALFKRFAPKIRINPDLDRKLVSYQADKETPFYGWFKYREGFTSRLVHYLLKNLHPKPGVLLDPFAGSGAALFGAASLGWKTHGIEVLPVGVYAIQARISAEQVDPTLFASMVKELKSLDFGRFYNEKYKLGHIAITKGAFPLNEEQQLTGYIAYCNEYISNKDIRRLALYAGFCVLEDISYTRKDGQYLRWDARSGRSQGIIPFNKGQIVPFSRAIHDKLDQMLYDILRMPRPIASGQLGFDFVEASSSATDNCAPSIVQGSCLEVLPTLQSGSMNVILTSPPYCNRYDYTRTYALELVYLGASHDDVISLRQDMLSCTVENRTKQKQLSVMYERLDRTTHFNLVDRVFHEQAALQEVLTILDNYRDIGKLNNANVARLVKNYFYEMCFVIFEMSRILAPGGQVIMVNDNVRYAGEEIPVDIILSSMAESFGLITDHIWTLARGKGNSSQQMGEHGRTELRKCVYVWRKPA